VASKRASPSSNISPATPLFIIEIADACDGYAVLS
jgi:hypothetical protein